MSAIERLRKRVALGEKCPGGTWLPGRLVMISYWSDPDGTPFKNVYDAEDEIVACGNGDLCREIASFVAEAANTRDLDAKLLAVVEAARNLKLKRQDHDDGCAWGNWQVEAEDALEAALEALEASND